MAPEPLPPLADDNPEENLEGNPENPLQFQPDVYPWGQPANGAGLTGHLLMPFLFTGLNPWGHLPVDAGLDADEPIRWVGFDRGGGVCVPIRLMAAVGTDLLTGLLLRQQTRVADLWRIERERYQASIRQLMGEESFLTDLQIRSTNALHWAEQMFARGDDDLGTIRAGGRYFDLATRPRRRRYPVSPYALPRPVLHARASRERSLIENTILRVASCSTTQSVAEVMDNAVSAGTQGILD